MSDSGRATAGRRADIDALRIIGAFAVITIHGTGWALVPTDAPGVTYWVALTLNAAARFAVPLFFAIAGWAQLRRQVGDDDTPWLADRLVRLVLPLVLWSVIYLAWEIFLAALSGGLPWDRSGLRSWLEAKGTLLAFGPGVKGQLWFMYFLIPMTVIIWLIRSIRVDPAVGLDGDRRRGLLGSAVVAILFLGALGAVSVLRLPVTWTNFTWTIAYAVIGSVILVGPVLPWRWLGPLLYVAATTMIAVLGHVLGYNSWPYFNQAPTVAVATVGMLLIGRSLRVPEAWRERAARLAGLTFGVYLGHFLVLDAIDRILDAVAGAVFIPGLVRLAILLVGTVVGTFGLVAAWHRLGPRAVRLLG